MARKGTTRWAASLRSGWRARPTAAKVNELLDGIPLGFAATIPDRIKSWDRNGERGTTPHGFKMPEHPKIEAQLRAFWEANKPTDANDDAHPSHHWFHYTDVPLAGNEKYADGKAGRSQWDIVHMINYCCRVLSGQESEQNARAITRPVALILLAHYVGDHPPAACTSGPSISTTATSPTRTPIRTPWATKAATAFILNSRRRAGRPIPVRSSRRPRLHGYWDSNTVKLAHRGGGRRRSERRTRPSARGHARRSSSTGSRNRNPANWKPAPNLAVKDWAESWANEILPVAREAHDRLQFTQLKPETSRGKSVVGGCRPRTRRDSSPLTRIGRSAWCGSNWKRAATGSRQCSSRSPCMGVKFPPPGRPPGACAAAWHARAAVIFLAGCAEPRRPTFTNTSRAERRRSPRTAPPAPRQMHLPPCKPRSPQATKSRARRTCTVAGTARARAVFDCSGATSYVLRAAGRLRDSVPSEGFRHYGESGPGRWISVYARDGHVFLVVAGLRFDTGWTGHEHGRDRVGPGAAARRMVA